MNRVATLVGKGYTIGDATRMSRWSRAGYEQARSRYPEFAERIDAIRQRTAELDGDVGGAPRPEPPDFATWRMLVFGHETPEHHAEIVEHLSGKCGGADGSGTCKRLLVLAFPESAKTTLGMEYDLYDLCWESYRLSLGERILNPMRTAVITETGRMAAKISWQTRQALTDKALYPELHRYGPFRDIGCKWSEDEIYMQWRSAEEKEPSLQWLGWKNQVQGARLTKIRLDDVYGTESGPSEAKGILRKLDHTWRARVGATGSIHINATYVDENDIYWELEERADRGQWHVVKIPAQRADGEPTWPRPDAGVDRAYYERTRAEMNNDALYDLVYQQVRSLGAAATFGPDAIEAMKRHELNMQQPFDDGEIIVGIDPSDTGPYAAHALSYSRSKGAIRTIDILAGPAGGTERMIAAVRWAIAMRAHYLQIEKQGGLSMFMSRELERECERNHVTVEYVPTTGQGLHDARYGTNAMAHWMRSGRWELPWAEGARRVVEPMIRELLWYDEGSERTPKDHVRAAWFCFRKVLERAGPRSNIRPFGRASERMPWLRQHQRSIHIGTGAVVPLRREA